ncbi:type I restriction enzyme HsdR N-terminal domain-containing protein [Propionicimonas sp.]|uniref:type I restriction endonuclease n=1 Tax=Propionicimonas sp. TaxID=1955623 RepID=UPI0017F37614|nr:type I restriction enzyme HsdR N-terminal domain-containing protein [Propionicimonas sp.]MBU3975734.1 type I restriction enzyme HsdR N-terminal domain-containing protein [Actinomycetota bacterium]MBA3019863.1 restriction endonuclease [Propionicimonas sp.]MBU3986117.1 type I restriction enzyme HsdR N-terminal domain-containing protein [Actinomycetota bacterium]MBU4007450.1 type I restriction enzyme HsdR N-terminal domain-containing protein [Actinomycetota bacterium]MBU4063944.1 type I restri
MSFEDALEDLASKIEAYGSTLATEEATKTAVVMPFIGRVLGYDVFNPAEVIPEFVCDVGTKRGEKIDFALVRDDKVQVLVEAKKIGEPLKIEHAGQLVRYFHVSNARIAILTNGRDWHFYTDLDRPNVMDAQPFLRLDLANVDPYILPELKKLTKDEFDLDSVLAAAGELKYVSAVKRAVGELFADQPEDFVRLLILRVYSGSITAKVREVFNGIVRKALAQYVNDRVNDRLKTALKGQSSAVGAAPSVEPAPTVGPTDQRDEIETTLDEVEGYNIVRAIVVSEVDYLRVVARDTKSYCGILLDDNNRKPICRLHFNRGQKYLGLFDSDKQETRVPIDRVEDIYRHADHLRLTAKGYEN